MKILLSLISVLLLVLIIETGLFYKLVENKTEIIYKTEQINLNEFFRYKCTQKIHGDTIWYYNNYQEEIFRIIKRN